jgi:CheY-like chemotaxis protein
MQHLIPACYFPSTALFLDDSHDFLLNFVLQLDEGVAFRIFDRPSKALEYIRQNNAEANLLRKYCSGTNIPSEGETGSPSKLSGIYKEVYNPNRFTEVSVIVVDYAMPEMNGIEFCRQLDNPKIKKILLTGQADEKTAIKAFNEGLIHKYVKKSESHAAEIITKSIYDFQMQYFQATSQDLAAALSAKPPLCILDKKFAEFFNNFCREKRVVEYYLIDRVGSYLLLDEDANTSFLIVKDEKEMCHFYEIAAQNKADETILKDLETRRKIPACWNNTNLDTYLNWAELLVPAMEIQGESSYYFAYISGNSLFDIRQQKILSYHRFLEEIDAAELLLEK